MKLSSLRECVTTGAIAMGPMKPFLSTKKKKKKTLEEAGFSQFGYLGGIKKNKQPTKQDKIAERQPVNKMTNVWTSFKSPKGKDSWEKQYAATNNPDERLLKQHRGKGY